VDDGDGVDRVEGRKRVNAALATMVTEANKRGIGDSSKKAAVGFCFGGGNVLELELALGAAILCRTGSSRVSRAVRISQILFSN
jgi:dienelactone hydrolase